MIAAVAIGVGLVFGILAGVCGLLYSSVQNLKVKVRLLEGRLSDAEKWRDFYRNQLYAVTAASVKEVAEAARARMLVDEKTKSLVRLAASNTTPGEASTAALLACRRLSKIL